MKHLKGLERATPPMLTRNYDLNRKCLKILLVSPYLPKFPGGGAESRTFMFLKHLGNRHEVTFLSYVTPEEVDHLPEMVARHQEYCKESIYLKAPAKESPANSDSRNGLLDLKKTRSAYNFLRHALFEEAYLLNPQKSPHLNLFKEALVDLLRRETFDILQIESSILGLLIKELSCRPATVIGFYDLASLLHYRVYCGATRLKDKMRGYIEWRKLLAHERWIAEAADHCITVSEVDRAQLLRIAPTARVLFIPNGVDTGHFTPSTDDIEPHRILLCGSMFYQPNVEAAEFFCHEIFPLIRRQIPDATLCIVGKRPHPNVVALSKQKGVVVTGEVDDIRPYFRRSALVVVPLRNGSGTRIRILEAMAMGKVVVSTSVGAEGLGVQHLKHLLIADEPRDFAKWSVRLLTDKELRSRLEQNGREFVVEQHDWERIASRMDVLYQNLYRGPLPSRVLSKIAQ